MNTYPKILEIELVDEILMDFEVENELNKSLIKLSHINVFIGENNSGKSRFLRTIFNEKKGFKHLNDEASTNNIDDISMYLIKNFIELSTKFNLKILPEDFTTNTQLLTLNSLGFIQKAELLNYYSNEIRFDHSQSLPTGQHRTNSRTLIERIKRLKSDIHSKLKLNKIEIQESSFDKKYIPILRGLRPINTNNSSFIFSNSDTYKYRTIKDYFSDFQSQSEEEKINIDTGLNMYIEVKNCLLGDLPQREFVRNFEKYIASKFFRGEEITLIPKTDKDVLTLKIGKNQERPIYDLGDGLQSLIIISFSIMNCEEPTLFFIEEPEMHLHPKWQKLLVSTLLDFPQHQYFISTHSNAFINAENTSVYKVHFDETKNKTCIKNVGFTGKRSILSELGYEASDLMQTNYVLWVEGFSDKIYINYWIQSLAPDLKEGIHYSIMFYGGSNIQHLELEEHFNNLLPLNSNFGIVIDSDKNSETANIAAYKVNIQSKFDSSNRFCWLTKKREIENYLPHEVLTEAVQEGQRSSDEIKIDKGDFVCKTKFSKLDSTPIAKPKIKLPQEIFSEYQREGTVKNIKAADLKKAIDKVLKENEKPSFLSYNKIQVAKRVTGKAPKVEGDELLEKLKELIGVINKANSL